MEGKAAKWLQMYKMSKGLGGWDQFISAFEEKFGAQDYREAVGALLELKQNGSVEEYTQNFDDLRYQITMHNTGYDELFFVS